MNFGNDALEGPLAPVCPAERVLVSGFDAPYVSTEHLDAHEFLDFEKGREQIT